MGNDRDWVLGENYDLNPDCLDDPCELKEYECECNDDILAKYGCELKFYEYNCKLWCCLKHGMIYLTIEGKEGFKKELKNNYWEFGDMDYIHCKYYNIENIIKNYGSEFEDVFDLINYLEDEYCFE